MKIRFGQGIGLPHFLTNSTKLGSNLVNFPNLILIRYWWSLAN